MGIVEEFLEVFMVYGEHLAENDDFVQRGQLDRVFYV